MLGILSLWRSFPIFYQHGIQSMDDMEAWLGLAEKMWEAPVDISVKISAASSMRRVSEHAFMSHATGPNHFMAQIVKLSL